MTNDEKSVPAMTYCRHVEQISSFDVIQKRLKKSLKPSAKCDACQTKGTGLWMCLNNNCKSLACGRNAHGHALKHFKAKHSETAKDGYHAIAVQVHTGMVWCYACDEEIVVGDVEADVGGNENLRNLHRIVRYLRDTKAYQSAPQPSPRRIEKPIGAIGLTNLGNTCYMNAALQLIVNSSALARFFTDVFDDDYYFNGGQHHRVVGSMQHLFELMKEGKSDILTPHALIRNAKSLSPIFYGYSQQDSSEFFRCLLDKLNDDLRHVDFSRLLSSHRESISTSNLSLYKKTLPKKNPEKKPYQDPRKLPKSKIARAHIPYRSIISDNFQGVLQSKVHCLVCGKDSLKDDPFFDLQVAIDKRSMKGYDAKGKSKDEGNTSFANSLFGWFTKSYDLSECLRAFVTPEKLTGGDRYKCETCKALTDCTKQLCIAQPPELLCIQLKRFRYDSYFSSKLSTFVRFPIENFDIREYCKADVVQQGPQNTMYDLVGIINHRGSLGGGHYIGYCKNPVNGTWYEFDDSLVTAKSPESIERIEAYVLMYQKQAPGKREERQAVLERIFSETTQESCYISGLWFNRWKTMSDPGPLTNYDFTCEHGGIEYTRMRGRPGKLFKKIPIFAYNFFAKTYGTDGGPFIQSIAPCPICERLAMNLTARRTEEKVSIATIDSRSIQAEAQWFLIHSEWIMDWHAFINGENMPGPISNEALLEKDEQTPRKGLKQGKHYRGVNLAVWTYFHDRYGGGPVIQRPTINIYT